MKKTTIISMFVFWAVVVSVLTAGLVFFEKNPATKLNQSVLGINKIENSSDKDIKLTSEEVAKHNSASNCWMIISNKVYNFSSYLDLHPPGAASIIPYCGKDGTDAFFGKPHSKYANSLLPDYFIGDLNSIILGKKSELTPSQIPGTVQKKSIPAKTIAIPPPVITQPPLQPATVQSQGNGITAADVAMHSSANDCWMIVNGKVYNVTSYIGSHPGGTGSISSYCGKDAAGAFYGLPHSQNAASILASYYIGDLGSTSTQNQSGQTTAIGQPTFQSPVRRDREDREEDDDD